jgi:hypothetical protein
MSGLGLVAGLLFWRHCRRLEVVLLWLAVGERVAEG